MVDGDLAEIEHEHLVYPDGLQSLTAAVRGQGIALVPMYLCEDQIESGQLELLSAEVYEYRNRYYFVSPAETRANQALDNLCDWLLKISEAHRNDNTAG